MMERRSKSSNIARELKKEILSRRLPRGTRIESVHELSQRFSIAPVTADRVLDLLVDDDVLYRKPNRGTFIKYDPEVKPRLGYCGNIPTPSMTNPATWEGIQSCLETFNQLGCHAELISYHELRQTEYALRKLSGIDGIVLNPDFLDESTRNVFERWPGQIVIPENCVPIETASLNLHQVIPDYRPAFRELILNCDLNSYDRILFVNGDFAHALAEETLFMRLLELQGVCREKFAVIRFKAVATDGVLEAYRHFENADPADFSNTLIVSMSSYFTRGIAEAFQTPARLPDLLNVGVIFEFNPAFNPFGCELFFTSISRETAAVKTESVRLLHRIVREKDTNHYLVKVPAKLILRNSIRKLNNTRSLES